MAPQVHMVPASLKTDSEAIATIKGKLRSRREAMLFMRTGATVRRMHNRC